MAVHSQKNLTIEVSEEEMISLPNENYSSRRIGRFLGPRVTDIDGQVFNPPLDSVNPTLTNGNSVSLKVTFVGWKNPQRDWKTWVNRMQSLHHSTWEKAGITDAIINSTFDIHRNQDQIIWVAEKWCSRTSTFVFPWGEATITLEDVMVLGGYSVLGGSVLSAAGDGESEMITDKLLKARSDLNQTKAKKAQQYAWMTQFMTSGSEIEHEAFLAYWLSRFVFPYGGDTIGRSIFPVAVRLSRGTKLALAPAVLADIYGNLSSLKESLVATRKLGTTNRKPVLEVKLTAPLQLVQAWVWERFPTLSPTPNSYRFSEPRLARWGGLKKLCKENVLSVMDNTAKVFIWRPYVRDANNSLPPLVYKENSYSVFVESGLGDELLALVRCLRTSELVSLEGDCIQQYLPHRVAMQFGMDQDLPAHVARVNASSKIAWRNYTRAVGDTKLYVPSQSFEPSVTARYLKWWKNLKLPSGSKSEDLAPPPGFPPKYSGIKGKDTSSTKFQDKRTGFGSPLKDAKNSKVPLPSCNFSPKRTQVGARHSSTKNKEPGVITFESSSTQVGTGDSGTKDKEPVVDLSKSESDENCLSPEEPVEVELRNRSAGGLKRSWGGEVDDTSKGNPKSCSRTTTEAPGMELEERLCTIEKLCAWLQAGNHCLDDIKMHRRES